MENHEDVEHLISTMNGKPLSPLTTEPSKGQNEESKMAAIIHPSEEMVATMLNNLFLKAVKNETL
ncbi:hypothetical protein DCAR_0205698 [Daucus carota subsp. sativus]|uniref:Uncharacterized protein n=1 Tax=Daucus carota subsp. sativus TaxID=79200 RepID=A0A161Y4S1_DAUCS|nr:hypothetical protein DCAR_0205698 [Daucus carota subsp. sativus]